MSETVTAAKPEPEAIHYTVDGEQQKTMERRLTPRQIIVNAGLNPDDHYLVQIRGRAQISYKDRMDKPIEMKDGMEFVTVFCGTAPVS